MAKPNWLEKLVQRMGEDAPGRPTPFSGGLRCGKTTLMAEHAARAIDGDNGGTYAPSTRWQDGALAEEHMRPMDNEDANGALLQKLDVFMPFYGRVRILSQKGESLEVAGERAGPMAAHPSELRVHRMPKVGSRWTDSTGQIHLVMTHWSDFQVESIAVDANQACVHNIEDWYAQMRPAPSKCVVYAENVRPGQHVAIPHAELGGHTRRAQRTARRPHTQVRTHRPAVRRGACALAG